MNDCIQAPPSCDAKSIKRLQGSLRNLKTKSPFSCSTNASEKEENSSLTDIKHDQFYVQKLKGQRQKIQSLKQDYEAKQDQLAQKEHEIQLLKQKLLRFKEIKDLHQDISTKLQKQNFQFKRLQNQTNDVRSQLQKVQKENYKQAVHQARELLAKQLAHNQQAQLQNQRLKQYLQNQKSQIGVLQQSYSQEIHNFKNKWDQERQRHQQLKQQAQSNLEKHSILKQQIENLSEKVVQEEKELKDLRLNEKALSVLLDEKNEAILQATRSSESCQNQFNKTFSQYQVQIQKINSAGHKLHNIIANLKKNQIEGQKKINLALEQISQTNNDIQNSTLQLKMLGIKARSFEQQGQKSAQCVKSLEERIAKLQHSLKNDQGRRVDQKKVLCQIDNIRSEMQRQRNMQLERIDQVVSSFRK